MTSAQSTPPNSILSDSTILVAEAAMNPGELIPRLIDRLDRKLIVMKEEQLTLMREIELNETTGQRLFESMKQHLTVNEYEKISLHAKEIEKVTKLILSLKLRLKKVEAELKERSAADARERSRLVAADAGKQASLAHISSEHSAPSSGPQNTSQWAKQKASSLRVHQSQESSSMSSLKVAQIPAIRGVSDPTSTTGLPKRNHQHHASLQSTTSDHQAGGKPLASHHHPHHHHHHHHLEHDQSSLTNSSGSSRVCSPRSPTSNYMSNLNHQPGEIAIGKTSVLAAVGGAQSKSISIDSQEDPDVKTANSTSNDSIFNSADSAIGSTITGHGGSATNIEQPAISQSSLSSSSYHSSLVSSASSTQNHHSKSPSQSHLSSSISVSSHSSMSSVPNSPPLNSPASTTFMSSSSPSVGVTCLSQPNKPPNNTINNINSTTTTSNNNNTQPTGSFNDGPIKTPASGSNGSLNSSTLSAFFGPTSAKNAVSTPSAKIERGGTNLDTTVTGNDQEDSMVHLLTDVDILIAKRDKLTSQLEEAYQLEECIMRRNSIIVERILKKYYDADETNGEIAEFKQFTRLKSLLLKDTHDVADRIDSAELQLTDLKQSNSCSV